MTTRDYALVAAIALLGVALLWVLWAWLRLRGRDVESPDTAYTRGLTALVEGRPREALRALKEAVQHDSENLDAYIRLGDLLRESGDTARALAVHRDLTVRPRLEEPERIRILESLTRDYLVAGRFEEAGTTAERLRQIHRPNRFAFEALRRVAENLGDWNRAVQVVDERVKVTGEGGDPYRARYRGHVGVQELQAGNRDTARRRFEEALKLDSDCLPAYLYIGDMDLDDGSMERAVDRWKELAMRSPENASVVFERLERAMFELGQFGEVVAFYRELLHRTPPDASVPALLALAEIHRRKGELDEAESFVTEALEVDPDDARAHRHRVKLSLDRGDVDSAQTHLDHFLTSLDAHHPETAPRFLEDEG